LVAIQDDAFDTIRDDIVQNPTKDVEAFLTDLRNKDSAIQLKDGASSLTGDGLRSRRTGTQLPNSKSHDSKQVRFSQGNRDPKKPFIPRFPDSWKEAFGPKLFGLLLQYRSAIIKGENQAWIDNNLALSVKEYNPKPSRKNRRTAAGKPKTSNDTNEMTATSPATTTSGDKPDAEEPSDSRPRKRIQLAKSRRVVTDIPA
jgi:hypothetical protein